MAAREEDQKEPRFEFKAFNLNQKDAILHQTTSARFYTKFVQVLYVVAAFLTMCQYFLSRARGNLRHQAVFLAKLTGDLYLILLVDKKAVARGELDYRRLFFNAQMTYQFAVAVLFQYDQPLFLAASFAQLMLQAILIHVQFSSAQSLSYVFIVAAVTFYGDFRLSGRKNAALFHALMTALLVLYNSTVKLFTRFNSFCADFGEQQNYINQLFSALVKGSIPYKVYKQICEDQIPCTHTRQDDIVVCIAFLDMQESDEIFAAKCYMFTLLLDKLCEIVGMLKVKSGFADYVAITDKFIAYNGVLQDITRKQLFNQGAIFSQFVLEVSRVVDFHIKLILTVGDINFYVNGFQKCYIWCNISGPAIEKARHLLGYLDRGIYLDHTSILQYCNVDDSVKAQKKTYSFSTQVNEMHIITSYIRKNQKPPKLFSARQLKFDGQLYEVDLMDLSLEAKELFAKVLEMMLLEKSKIPQDDNTYQNQREIKMMLDNVDNISIRQSSSIQYSCTSCDISEYLSVKLGFDISSDESDDINKDFSDFTQPNPRGSIRRMAQLRPNLETVEENENDSNLRAFLEKYRRYIDSLELKYGYAQLYSLRGSEPFDSLEDDSHQKTMEKSSVFRTMLTRLKFQLQISRYANDMSYNSFFYQAITANYSLLFLVKIPFLLAVLCGMLYLNSLHSHEIYFIFGFQVDSMTATKALLRCGVLLVCLEAYLLYVIQKYKAIDHKVKQFDERIYLCSSLMQSRSEEACFVENVTVFNRIYRATVMLYQFILYITLLIYLTVLKRSAFSYERLIALLLIELDVLFLQQLALCLGSPYFMSIYDASHLLSMGVLLDVYFAVLALHYDYFYVAASLVLKYVHFFSNAYTARQFCKFSLINKTVLEKSEKYARKLQCFQLPITIQAILQNQTQLAYLYTFNFPQHLIYQIRLSTIQLDYIGVKAREINKRRERLLNEIGITEATDAQKLALQNLNIQQFIIQHEKDLLFNQLNQRILFKFEKCFVLHLRLQELRNLKISQQTTVISYFFDVTKQQVDNIQSCFVYKIEGSCIGVLFYQENNASFEFFNQLQLAISIALGVILIMSKYIHELKTDGLLSDSQSRSCKLTAAIAHGSCYGSVLGDYIYRFDILGAVRRTVLYNAQNARPDCICIDRALYKYYLRESARFDEEIRANGAALHGAERVALCTDCIDYDYIYITGIK